MPNPLHPHYDEVGVTYDGGFFYSDGLPDVPPTPTPKNKKRMASSPFNLNLGRLNREQTLSMINTATAKMGPPAPATPPIAGVEDEVAASKASSAAAAAKKAAWEAAKALVVTTKAEMDAAMDTARDDVRALASAVEAKAKGNPLVWAASGLPLASDPVASTVPAALSNFSVTASDMSGGLDMSWDPEINSATYELEVTTVDPVAGPWVRLPSTTKSNASALGLESGKRAWARARGVGPKGEGPWSDPGTRIVP